MLLLLRTGLDVDNLRLKTHTLRRTLVMVVAFIVDELRGGRGVDLWGLMDDRQRLGHEDLRRRRLLLDNDLGLCDRDLAK